MRNSKQTKLFDSDLKGIFKKYSYLILVCLSIFYSEMILRLNIDVDFWGIGILYSFLFSLFSAIIIYVLVTFLKRKMRKAASILISIVLTLLFCSQLIYYKIFFTFFTLYSAQKGEQVLEFMPEIIAFTVENSFWILLLFIPFIINIIIFKKIGNMEFRHWRQKFSVALAGVFVFILTIFLIQIGDKDQNSAYDMYYKNDFPIYSVMDLGLLTTFRLDIKRTVFGFAKEEISLITSSEGSDSSNNSANTSSNPSITPESTIDTPTPTVMPSKTSDYNIIDIDFNKLSKNTTNQNIIDMNNYFKKVVPTAKNDYTGKFKGYNLILITAESFSRFAIDKNVTPTLYKMSNEGFKFNNFYNPVWGVSTSDGEYVATTGLIPKSGVWSMLKSGSNYMPFAMGNQLKALNYNTLAFHNHSYKYYGRDISHPNLGYVYKGVGNGLMVKKTWPESDVEMMEKTVDDYINKDFFHTYYMTVSGHLRYNFTGNFIAKKNKALVAGIALNEGGKAYMATQIELDKAMEYLLKRLENAKVAEKTLIVISPDHYPYGLKKPDIDNLAGHVVESNFELYKSSLIIYAKGMKPQIIDRPVSSLDIVPTISNLLGLKYDSRLLMGIDCFSNTPPLIIFSNRSFITDKCTYNAYTKELLPTTNNLVSKDYRIKISKQIDDKFYNSVGILDNNYYALLNLK